MIAANHTVLKKREKEVFCFRNISGEKKFGHMENIHLSTLSPKSNTGKAKHKDKRRTGFDWIKWAIVSTSIAATIAIFVYFTYSLAIKGINWVLPYCQT